jgi:hypothetical protein
MKTLTLAQVADLSFTGRDNLGPSGANGFVRTPDGYISSHAAYELVAAGKLDPTANRAACAKQDWDRNEGVAAAIEREAVARREVERAAAQAEAHERWLADQEVIARNREAFEKVPF